MLAGTQLHLSTLYMFKLARFSHKADGIATEILGCKYNDSFLTCNKNISALLSEGKNIDIIGMFLVLIGTCFQEEKTLKHQLFLTNSTLPSASILSSKASSTQVLRHVTKSRFVTQVS